MGWLLTISVIGYFLIATYGAYLIFLLDFVMRTWYYKEDQKER